MNGYGGGDFGQDAGRNDGPVWASIFVLYLQGHRRQKRSWSSEAAHVDRR